MQREFPFFTRIGDRTVKVLGLHWSGRYFESDGAGLLPLSVKPMEPQEPGPAYAQVPVTSPDPAKVWRRQGCFKSDPLPRYDVQAKADKARNWLRKTLDGGLMPAAEVIRLAHKAGMNEWALRRAKKRLGVRAVKVGGRRQGWGAKWFWTAARAER